MSEDHRTSAPGQLNSRTSTASTRAAAALLLAGAVIMVIFMALHPSLHTHNPNDVVEEVTRIATRNAIVHGTLIAVQGLVLLGLLGLADRVGTAVMLTRGAIAAFATGALAHTGAATVNGFIVPSLMARAAHGDNHGHGVDFDTLTPVFVLCREANGSLARLGVVATSAAIVLFSVALAGKPGLARLVGAAGILAGVGLLIVTLAGVLPMDVHGFTIRVVVQSIWFAAAAVLMLLRRV